jgi:hypothetical protein
MLFDDVTVWLGKTLVASGHGDAATRPRPNDTNHSSGYTHQLTDVPQPNPARPHLTPSDIQTIFA